MIDAISDPSDYRMERAVELVRARASVRMTLREALDHVLDARRTRIEPGADPRASWCAASREKMAGVAFTGEQSKTDLRGRVRRNRLTQLPITGLVVFELTTSNGEHAYLNERPSGAAKFVPIDVLRWRDEAYTAPIKARARNYAALQPGARR